MTRSGSTLLPDKKRLRWILIAFFLAVAIPTAFLLYQSLDQLKWQAVYQYRGVATELAQRIDADLVRRARRESARPLGDYAFFSVVASSRTDNTNFQLRSPLSAYPVVAELPGTIGHFQVDENGSFSTPLLPIDTRDRIGLPPAELVLRDALRNEILQVLRDNELIATSPPIAVSASDQQDASKADALGKRRDARRQTTRDESSSTSDGANAAASAGAGVGSSMLSGADSSIASASAPSKELAERTAALPRSKRMASQRSNFDRLSRESASQDIGKIKNSAGLRKLEELNLDQSIRRRAPPTAPAAPAPTVQTERLAETDDRLAEPASETSTDTDKAIVTTFENATDPFELSRLNSGQFVLYRRAWDQGRRLIQGMLIDPNRLIQEMVQPGFVSASISPISDLTVAFGDGVLTTLAGSGGSRYLSGDGTLRGTVLYESALSEPFNNMRLVFSVRQLPTNTGSSLVTWLALLVTGTMAAGLYGLYRLGIRRLELASQQQDFVAAVSHELKTPLTSIRMYGDILREGWASEEKKLTYYEYIHDESERLSRLIDNVLQLARMNRNDIDVKTQAMTPAHALDMIRSRTAATIERAGFTVTFDNATGSDDTKVLLDPDLFVQVMINLVDNALKFSANAGKQHIDISARRDDRGIHFSVRDYGPGIAEDQIRKIFGLFYRAETELTRETVGTGIGLALVSELVRAMDGRVDVTNTSPGARFEVTLPAA